MAGRSVGMVVTPSYAPRGAPVMQAPRQYPIQLPTLGPNWPILQRPVLGPIISERIISVGPPIPVGPPLGQVMEPPNEKVVAPMPVQDDEEWEEEEVPKELKKPAPQFRPD